MDGTEMLIGRAVCVMNPRARSRRLRAQAREPRHFVFARPSPFLPALIHFSLPSFFLLPSFAAAYSLKRGSQMPHQQGLPFITRRIHCSLPLLSSPPTSPQNPSSPQ